MTVPRDSPQRNPSPPLPGVARVTRVGGKVHTDVFRSAAMRDSATRSSALPSTLATPAPYAAKIYNGPSAGQETPQDVRILTRARTRVIFRCWQDHTRLRPRRTLNVELRATPAGTGRV
jgi:hypothetical protein